MSDKAFDWKTVSGHDFGEITHAKRGRGQLGRGLEHFFDEGTRLGNAERGIDPYVETARHHMIQGAKLASVYDDRTPGLFG